MDDLKKMYNGTMENTLLGTEDMHVLDGKINFAEYNPKIAETDDDFIPYLMALWAIHEADKKMQADWTLRAVSARVLARVMHFA